MNNQFKAEELVKVSGKTYPVVGGRLRLAHEENKALSIETNIISQDNEKIVIQAKITTEKGIYSGIGNASIIRDAKLKNAIIELAETRAIARALRFAGYGVEYTGYEEMPDDREEPEPKPNAIQIKALGELASKKGVNLAYTGREWTGKNSSKEWTMADYHKVSLKLDAMQDIAS